MFLKYHSWYTKSHPWVPNLSRNESQSSSLSPSQDHRPIPRFLGNSKFLLGVSSPTQHPFKPLFTMSFPAPMLRVPSGHVDCGTHYGVRRLSSKPGSGCSYSIRACGRSTCPGNECFNYFNGRCLLTMNATRLASPRLLLQETQPGAIKV